MTTQFDRFEQRANLQLTDLGWSDNLMLRQATLSDPGLGEPQTTSDYTDDVTLTASLLPPSADPFVEDTGTGVGYSLVAYVEDDELYGVELNTYETEGDAVTRARDEQTGTEYDVQSREDQRDGLVRLQLVEV